MSQTPIERHEWSILIEMADTMIPGTGSLPNASTAGIDDYLRLAMEQHLRFYQSDFTRLANGADKIAKEKFGKLFFSCTHVEKNETIQSLETGGLEKEFRVFRDQVFAGYFAHPRWRNSKGSEIWSAISFQPVLRPSDLI